MDNRADNRDGNRDDAPVSGSRFEKGVSGNPGGRPRKITVVDDGEPVDPWKVLEQIASDRKTPQYSRVQAAKALMAAPAPEVELDWRRSVQVRPDYEPPSWADVVEFARSIGAF